MYLTSCKVQIPLKRKYSSVTICFASLLAGLKRQHKNLVYVTAKVIYEYLRVVHKEGGKDIFKQQR